MTVLELRCRSWPNRNSTPVPRVVPKVRVSRTNCRPPHVIRDRDRTGPLEPGRQRDRRHAGCRRGSATPDDRRCRNLGRTRHRAASRSSVSVRDSGIGFPKRHRESVVFEPILHDQEANGLGMGLAICKTIVEAHGGRISVRRQSRRLAGRRCASPLPKVGEARIAMPLEPTVFVIDDDQAVRESMKWLVESIGLPGPDLHESRAGVSRQPIGPDMTGLPGPRCAHAGNEWARLAGTDSGMLDFHLPVIVMTGFGDVSTAVRAMKGGAVDFIEKPFRDQSHARSDTGQCLENAMPSNAPLPANKVQGLHRANRHAELTAAGTGGHGNLVVAGLANKEIAREMADRAKDGRSAPRQGNGKNAGKFARGAGPDWSLCPGELRDFP